MNHQDKSKAVGDNRSEGEEGFRKIFDSVKDAILIETPEGRILDVNRAACEMLGYTREELLAMDVAGIVPPEIAARLPRTIQRKTTEKGVYVESENLRKDGVRIPVEVSSTLIELGGEKRVISILRDLTERKRALNAIRESEEKFHEIFDSVKDAIFIETPEGKIVDVNMATCALIGYTKEELLTMDVADIVPPEIATRLEKYIQKETVEKGVYVESESLRKDGSRIPVEVSNTLVGIGGKKRVVAILRDITERKRAEAELKRYQEHLEELVEQRTAELAESEDRLRKIFEFTKDAMFIEKPTGEIIDVNKATCGMLGYSKDELLTKRVGDVVPPDVAATLARTIQKRTVQEGVYVETEDMRKDGRRVPVEVSCTLVDIKGEERVIAILRDISERKQAEDALRESEERFRKIFNNTKDAIFVEKPGGSFVDVNEAACRMLGYTKKELLGKAVGDVVPSDVAERLPKTFVLKMAEEGLYYEAENIKKDGTRIAVQIGNSMVEIGGEKRIITIVRDITERKAAEEELLKYRTQLEKMVQERTAKLASANERLRLEIAERKRSEKALRDNERKVRAIFDQSFQFIGLMTKDGTLIEVNRTAMQFAGIKESECLGKPFWETPWWTHSAEMQNKLHEAVIKAARGKCIRFEATHPAADGNIHNIDFSLKPIKDESGKVIFLVPEGRDITERKRLENAVKKEKQELELIINSSPVLIFYKNREGRFVHVNKAFGKALKIPEENFLGKTVFDLYSAAIAQGMTNDDQEVFKSGRPKLNIIEQYESASGMRWAQTDKVPIFDQNGVLIGLVGFAQDITARKQAEESLRGSEMKLREQKVALEKKNIALREILEQIEIEKKQIKDDIVANVEHLMMPVVRKIKARATNMEKKYIEILRHNLKEIASSFGRKISDRAVRLSPREIEICNMIKGGSSSKEIAELLHLTLKTVERHRFNIRKKLKIAHDINLTSYLQSV